uniref:Uncharacterized protein n=1 Tax=Arundo donax TaxID=35708 RepID=A0A0A9BBR2_ARUDO
MLLLRLIIPACGAVICYFSIYQQLLLSLFYNCYYYFTETIKLIICHLKQKMNPCGHDMLLFWIGNQFEYYGKSHCTVCHKHYICFWNIVTCLCIRTSAISGSHFY